MSIVIHDQTFTLNTKNTTYMMQADDLGYLLHLYYGPRADLPPYYLLVKKDRGFSGNPYDAQNERGYSLDVLPQEFPFDGSGDYRTSSLSLRTQEGVYGCDLRFQKAEVIKGKTPLRGLPAMSDQNVESLEITLEDSFLHVDVVLAYSVYEDVDIITRSVRVINHGETITIENIKFLDIDQLNTTFTVIFDYRRRVYRPDHEKLEFLSKLQDLAFNEFILLYSSLIASLNSMNTNKTITLNMISRLSLNVRQKDRIYRLAVDTLNQINIKNAMLLIYPKELTYVRTAYNFSCPDMFFLKGHVRDGLVVDTHNAFFTVNQLLEVFPGDYKTISTISFNEHQYGLLITDASPDQLSDVEFLVSQIGNTIYITGILENLNLQSITDELTGVFNRRGILEKLTETVASLRHDEFAYILFVDLDHLKLINDKYGHDAGDQAIKAQADVLTEAFPRDLVGRIGGDEFMVILKTRYPSFIATVSSRIEESEAKIRHSRHFKFPFRLSYGMSVFDHNYSEDEIQRVIDNADSFMYQQKQQHHRESDFDEIGKN